MPIRKKGDIDIRTSANGAKVKQTGYTFYSYDKKSAALYFQFRGQDGQPTDLGKATIHLVMILNDDGGKEFIPKSDEIEVISAIRGTAKYVLPEMLLSYSGKVTGYVYMDFDDGSQSDDGQFTFRIKQSMITHVLPKAGDKYVQDFEDVKERVEQAGDSATKDIEKAKDNAESQIGEYAGEVESAKQDISSSASDVQSKASEAGKSIEESSKEVKKAKTDAIKSMRESDISDKNYLLDSKKRVLEEKSTGSASDKYHYDKYYLSEPMPAGTEFTVSGKLEITDGDFDAFSISFRDGNDAGIEDRSFRIEHINNEFSSSFTLSKTLYAIYIYAGISGETQGNGVIYTDVKLQTGPLATPWTPNPQQIVTQDQYDKLANGIQSSGGNLIQNGNFENGFTGWDPATSASLINNERTSGKAVRMTNGSTELITNIPVEPGRTYEYGYWYRTSPDFDGNPNNTKMRLGDKDDNLVDWKSYTGNTTEWKKLTNTRKIKSEDLYSLKISIESYGHKGWIDFSEVYLIDITRYTEIKSELEKIKQAIINLGGSI